MRQKIKMWRKMKPGFLGTIAACVVANGMPAFAADMPLKAPPMAPPAEMAAPGPSWTGAYLGIYGGDRWDKARFVHGSNDPSFPFPDLTIASPVTFNTGLFGLVDGYNFQIGQFVLGYEDDISFAFGNDTGSSVNISPFNPSFTNTARVNELSTFRGRIGYLVTPSLLFYGTGGAAYAGIQESVLNSATAIGISETHHVWGWTAGGGIEWFFLTNFSLKLDYLHSDFDNKSYFNPAISPAAPSVAFLSDQRLKVTDDQIRLALAVHLDWLKILTK
jgi:outer membrane immunogenic protein